MPKTTVAIDFHRVIVRGVEGTASASWNVQLPPADAFNPINVRVTPVSQVRAGDLVVGTIQHHFGPLLEILDRAQWVSYFSHRTKPQTSDARPFEPAHCDWCAHNAEIRAARRGDGHWTVDGCTTYRPDSLLLVVPRELVDAS